MKGVRITSDMAVSQPLVRKPHVARGQSGPPQDHNTVPRPSSFRVARGPSESPVAHYRRAHSETAVTLLGV